MTSIGSSIRIVQLYPELLGVTGDTGNVDVLATRARLAGIEVQTETVSVGAALTAAPDILVIGNGPASAVRAVHADLIARADQLRACVDDGTVVLAVGGGAELLTEGITFLDGSTLEGLSMIPATVHRTRERRVGYIVAENPDADLIGFEDHASSWRISADAPTEIRYARVIGGHGSIDAEDGARYETARVGQIYASNVQGPVLPLNPRFADALLSAAVQRSGGSYQTTSAHHELDLHAEAARAAIRKLASKQYTVIAL